MFLLNWIFVGQPWCPWVRVPLRLITTRAILREAKATRVCTLESGYANAEIRVAQFERHRRTTRQHPRHRGIGFSRSPRQSMRTFFRPSRDATGATVFLLVTLTAAFMATAEPRKVEVMAAIFVWRVRVYEIRATGSAYVMTSENKQNTKGGFAFNKCPRFIGSFAERRAVCEAQNYFTRQAFRDFRQRKATVRSRRDEAFPQNPSRTPFVARYSSSRERSSARPSRVSRSFPAHDVTAFLTENKQRVLETVLTQFSASRNGIWREKAFDVHQDPFRVRVRKEETDAEGTVAMIKMMTSCLFVRLSLSPRNLDRCEKN